MKQPAVALIDGEHYPAVVVEALRQAAERFDIKAALFLGGVEKIRDQDLEEEAEALYGVPVVFDPDWGRGLARVIGEHNPEVVVDLSDEPVLGYEERFRLISESLARGVGYVGSDSHSSPADLHTCAQPPGSWSSVPGGERGRRWSVSVRRGPLRAR